MSLAWFDRLKGRTCPSVPDDDVPGRWALLPANDDVRVNGQILAASRPYFLVPDRRDNWSLSDHENNVLANGRFGLGLLPDVTDVRAIRQVAAAMSEAECLEDLIRVSPLPVDLDDRVQRQKIDYEIESKLSQLVHVCHRPRQQLTTDLEKLPVGRAKRIPPRSIEFLASHSEDWKRRTATGIEPSHVVAEILEDQTNIYENRVAAALIDRIVHYLAERVAELEKIFALLNDEHNFRLALQVGKHFRLANRMSSLWGAAYLDEDVSHAAAETRSRLKHIRATVLGLKRTRLYRGVPQRRDVRRELHHTNILENDPHYREVAALWRAWHEYGEKPEKSEEAIFGEWQEANSNFAAFCRLIVIRAADDIGWKPRDYQEKASSKSAVLIGPSGLPANISIDESGVMTIVDQFATELRLVPLLAGLSRTKDQTSISTWIDDVMAQKGDVDTVVLYLGRSSEIEDVADEMPSLGVKLESLAASGSSALKKTYFIPVSPFEITSVEKVGRILNSWLLSHLLKTYPPRIKCPKNLASYLQLDQQTRLLSVDELALIKPIDHRTVAELFKRMDNLERPDVRRQVGQVSVNAVARVRTDLNAAVGAFSGILRCPVCGGETNNFLARGDAAYVCVCDSRDCDSEWGVKTCGGCHEPYSYILPNRSQVEQSVETTLGWLDRRSGRDCIAVPCAQATTSLFICSTLR